MINDAFMRLAGTSANPPVAGAVTALTVDTTSTSNFYADLGGNVPTSGTNTSGVQARDIGEGYPLHAVLTIVTAATQGTTVTFNIIVAENTAGTTNPVVIGSTGVLPIASITAGARFVIELQPTLDSVGKRYLMGQYVTGSTTALVGATHFLDIVTDYSDSKKFYAGGFAVS